MTTLALLLGNLLLTASVMSGSLLLTAGLLSAASRVGALRAPASPAARD